MSLRLILTRHAKSSWGDPLQGDHARPLNDRGRRSAEVLGAWLAQKDYAPSLVLSSDSARTRETWDLMAPHFPKEPRIDWSHGLYHAGAHVLLNKLQGALGRTVLLLAHNPGIGDFAQQIVTTPPSHGRFFDYPTAATTVIDFATESWATVDWRQGKVVDFVIPRDLIEG